DTARPFVGNLTAPATAVGIFAGDACNLFGIAGSSAATTPVGCTFFDASNNPHPGTLPDSTLISLTALGQTCLNPATASAVCNVVTVSKNQVRFIVNGGEAQTLFGTPFGTAGRNIVQDAITSIANLSVSKRIKFSERTAFEFRATATNVFNHPNFASIDPFVEDAGVQLQLFGFGDPTLSNSTRRRFILAGKFTF